MTTAKSRYAGRVAIGSLAAASVILMLITPDWRAALKAQIFYKECAHGAYAYTKTEVRDPSNIPCTEAEKARYDAACLGTDGGLSAKGAIRVECRDICNDYKEQTILALCALKPSEVVSITRIPFIGITRKDAFNPNKPEQHCKEFPHLKGKVKVFCELEGACLCGFRVERRV